ncbi:MAG TPA: FHA domain-containing protein, partial [Polyangiales bacterium]|nr:FHA domain-containing protein [Polyangiales bacterium]
MSSSVLTRVDAGSATLPVCSTEGGAGDGLAWYLFGLTCEPALVELGASKLVFGRGPESDVQLGGTAASRHHAELSKAGPVYLIRDLGSRNGTVVEGRWIKEAPLALHSVIRM